MPDTLVDDVKKSIRSIPDFPKKGILFRDITPLLTNAKQFKDCVDHFVSFTKEKIDYVVSIESRGFILGSALAYALPAGFVPIRKEGKLPRNKCQASYKLEYGSAVIEMHTDAIQAGSRVVLVDDVLATGGTMKAAIDLVSQFGAKIAGIYFLIELNDLHGRDRLTEYPVHSLIKY